MKNRLGVIPVLAFEKIRDSWEEILKQSGANLYGMLVYRTSDHYFPEYVSDEGLQDLHYSMSNRCLLFVFHAPGEDWVDYARTTKSLWAKLFDEQTPKLRQLMEAIPGLADKPILEIDGKRLTYRQMSAPPINKYLLDDEILSVMDYFGCKQDEHPCLMLFRNLAEKRFWFVDLREWSGWEKPSLQVAFRNYFEGRAFAKLLKEAGNV
jgi:hypothetical protein